MRLVLECVQADSCSVIFEPFGAEYILQAGDAFHIEITGRGTGDVQIWYGPGAISIAPWVGSDYSRVVASDGRVLAV